MAKAEAIGKRSIRPKEKEAILKGEGIEPKRTPHVTEFEDLVDILPELATESRKLAAMIAPLEKRRKELQGDIDALLTAVDQTSIRGDNWIAIRTPPSDTFTLTPEKLLEAGVSMEQIEAGYAKGEKAGYVQVKEWKPKAGTQ